MANIPTKIETRLIAGLKKFQPILANAKARDLNEADTVTIVKDLLAEVFGYDKYSEVTSEHAIRGTYCDLAIKLDGALQLLIEVKAIGGELKDAHVKQAVDYGANQGCEWVVLTNGVTWRVYRIIFGKPIDSELVVQIPLSDLNSRNSEHLELVWLLSKEGWQKARIGEFHAQRQAMNRYTLAALLLSEPLLDALRREIRKMSDGIKITNEQIADALSQEVLKRETVEGEKAIEAVKTVSRALKKQATMSARKAEKADLSSAQPPAIEAAHQPTQD